MKIIVVGCGKIGRTILASLVKEKHDVLAIDVNPSVISEITNVYDVMGICGNGTEYEKLKEAGAEKADLFIAAATMGVGRIRGIKRPALATPLPGLGGHRTVMCDLGANADVRPEMIVQFAQMGVAYAKAALGVAEPRVGLLNNGEEKTKGSEMALAFHAALEAADVPFDGNAEGTDLLLGNFDVIVSDGFTGNVALKTLEGTAKYLVGALKENIAGDAKAQEGLVLLASALKKVQGSLSGDEYGGALLLGVKAPVLIGHGATSAQAVCAGTLAAARLVRAGLVERIAESLTDEAEEAE